MKYNQPYFGESPKGINCCYVYSLVSRQKDNPVLEKQAFAKKQSLVLLGLAREMYPLVTTPNH